jgi:hypothetical protein
VEAGKIPFIQVALQRPLLGLGVRLNAQAGIDLVVFTFLLLLVMGDLVEFSDVVTGR